VQNAYYVNKISQNSDLKTCIWRHVVMLRTARTQ